MLLMYHCSLITSSNFFLCSISYLVTAQAIAMSRNCLLNVSNLFKRYATCLCMHACCCVLHVHIWENIINCMTVERVGHIVLAHCVLHWLFNWFEFAPAKWMCVCCRWLHTLHCWAACVFIEQLNLARYSHSMCVLQFWNNLHPSRGFASMCS